MTTHRHMRAILLLVLSTGAAAAQPARDPFDAHRTLIMHDLTTLVVRLESIEPGQVVVTDDRGLRRTIPSADLLALYDHAPRWRAELTELPTLSLVDGQRFRAMLVGPSGDGESVRMAHALLGPILVPLDRVISLAQAGADVPETPPSGEDVITLTNADVLAGFVLSIGDETTLELADGRIQTLDAGTIAAMRIANDPVAPAGAMLWLSDGSAFVVRSIRSPDRGAILVVPELAGTVESESDDAEVSRAAAPLTPPIGIGQVVAWTPDASRFVPLATLAMTRIEPIAPRVWTDPPRIGNDGGASAGGAGASAGARMGVARAALGAGEIAFHGPSLVEWAMPPRATGFITTLTLPESSHDWGDCEVVIHTRDGAGTRVERWRGRLNADTPRHDVAISLGERAAALIVTVEPGVYGAVQDTPVLTTPLIRLGAAAD